MATHLFVLLVVLVLFLLVGTTSSKKPKAPSLQIGSDEIWQDFYSSIRLGSAIARGRYS